METIFKYRPLSEFLFKELFYQELYFASYKELNDPLDLTARLEFTPETEDQVEFLVWLLFKSTWIIPGMPILETEREYGKRMEGFYSNETLRTAFQKRIYEKLCDLKTSYKSIELLQLEEVIYESAVEVNIGFEINLNVLKREIERLTNKFLDNSYTTSFTSTKDDFLMWSHYASKHTGICLEFTLHHSGLFPYKRTGRREADTDKYRQRISDWDIKEKIYWNGIRRVFYRDEQPTINFFAFAPIFDNEDDLDVIGLSKQWVHDYANELKEAFSTKTKPWAYEKEIRAIQINFGHELQPEARIRQYPLEALSSIYFGIRTPENVKQRIYDLYENLNKEIKLYDCQLSNGRELDFELWEKKE